MKSGNNSLHKRSEWRLGTRLKEHKDVCVNMKQNSLPLIAVRLDVNFTHA